MITHRCIVLNRHTPHPALSPLRGEGEGMRGGYFQRDGRRMIGATGGIMALKWRGGGVRSKTHTTVRLMRNKAPKMSFIVKPFSSVLILSASRTGIQPRRTQKSFSRSTSRAQTAGRKMMNTSAPSETTPKADQRMISTRGLMQRHWKPRNENACPENKRGEKVGERNFGKSGSGGRECNCVPQKNERELKSVALISATA